MSGEHVPPAARLHDPVAHSHALGGFLGGALVGLAAAAGVALLVGMAATAVAAEVVTGGLATPLVAGVAVTVGEFAVNAVVGGKLMGLAEDAGEALGSKSMGAPSGEISQGSPDVSINGLPAARVNDTESCDAGKVAQGSAGVSINGLSAARVGDKATCGAVIVGGSGDVFIGGGTATGLPVQPEVPQWARWAAVVVGILPALGGAARAIGPALAEVEATGLARAAQTGVKALGRAMEERAGGGLSVKGGASEAPSTVPGTGGAATSPELASGSGAGKIPGLAPVDQPIYRVDGRPPGIIFNEGFQPRGTSTDLENYVNTNHSSTFVSTSKTPEIADNPAFGQPGTHLYEIDGNGLQGIDVNKVYPTNPFANESEIAVPGGIPRESIISSRPILPGGGFGEAVPNPFYNGVK